MILKMRMFNLDGSEWNDVWKWNSLILLKFCYDHHLTDKKGFKY